MRQLSEGNVSMEADMAACLPGVGRGRQVLLRNLWRGVRPCQHLTQGFSPPEPVLNRPVCSHLLQQPRETNTKFRLAIIILTPS